MPEVMLRPNWPGRFNRTIRIAGSEPRFVTFEPGVPVEVSCEELAFLKPDIEKAIFEIERDEKNRARFVESGSGSVPTPGSGSNSKQPDGKKANKPDSKKAKTEKQEVAQNV